MHTTLRILYFFSKSFSRLSTLSGGLSCCVNECEFCSSVLLGFFSLRPPYYWDDIFKDKEVQNSHMLMPQLNPPARVDDPEKIILRKHQVLAELCATKCHAHDYKRHQRLISSSVLIANPCDGGCTACAKGAIFATLNSKMNIFPLEFRDNFYIFGISVKIRVTCQKSRP